jgi:hypothetical protein
MKHMLGKLGISVILSVIGSIFLVSWLMNSDIETSSFIRTDSSTNASIGKLDIEINNKNILLKVTLNQPMSCSAVFYALGITDIPLKNKIYSPTCTKVEPSLIIITYAEKITI